MKSDVRVRYTKMRIQEAFLQCLKEKPLNRITVKELCDMAEINRATFYTHYQDPFDLLKQLEAQCIQEIQRHLEEQRGQGGVLTAILRGVQNPTNMAALLGSPNGDPAFFAQIATLYHESFSPDLTERFPHLSEEERQNVFHFLSGGCSNLIAQWIKTGTQISPEVFAQRLEKLCNSFLETCKGA